MTLTPEQIAEGERLYKYANGKFGAAADSRADATAAAERWAYKNLPTLIATARREAELRERCEGLVDEMSHEASEAVNASPGYSLGLLVGKTRLQAILKGA